MRLKTSFLGPIGGVTGWVCERLVSVSLRFHMFASLNLIFYVNLTRALSTTFIKQSIISLVSWQVLPFRRRQWAHRGRFSCTGVLSGSLAKRNWKLVMHDEVMTNNDVLSDGYAQRNQDMLERECVSALHFGTHCQIWSIADIIGPFRTNDNVEGFGRTRPEKIRVTKDGNLMAVVTLAFFAFACRIGRAISVTNPQTSMLWLFRGVRQFLLGGGSRLSIWKNVLEKYCTFVQLPWVVGIECAMCVATVMLRYYKGWFVIQTHRSGCPKQVPLAIVIFLDWA